MDGRLDDWQLFYIVYNIKNNLKNKLQYNIRMSKKYKYFLKQGEDIFEFKNRCDLSQYIINIYNQKITNNMLDNYFLNRLKNVPEFFNNINRIRI